MQLPSDDARICLIVGRKGSGKSFRIKRGLAGVPVWVVWDLRGEYAHAEHGVSGARLWTDVRDFFRFLLAGGVVQREVFACPVWQFDAWATWVFETGNMLAVIEELPRVCSAGKSSPALDELLDRNRHAGVDLIAACSRTAGIPKSLVHQVDEVLVSQTREPNSLAYFRDWLGEGWADQIATLETHSFLRIEL